MRGNERRDMTEPLHITFATRDYLHSARALQKGVASWGFRTRLYTPRDPVVRELTARYPSIMSQSRGAGYWLWKPAIILDALRRSAENDIVLYTDAGVLFEDDPRRLTDLVKSAPIALFDHPKSNEGRLAQRNWTKRDCFVLLGADTEEHWNKDQLTSAFVACRNCSDTRSLIEEWYHAATDDRVLTDRPNTMGLPNLDGFVDHRHDQSVLTILAVRHAIPAWPSPEVDGEHGRRVVDHFRRRPSWFMARTERLRALLKPRTRLRALAGKLRALAGRGGRA